MGFKVIITESATKDLSELVGHIAHDNDTAAARLGYAILARFQVLERFPFLGRKVPERHEEVWRELIYKSWRLIYFVDEPRKIIYAARVWHGARGEPILPELD
jgi:plasmid stabilization system protein ParE